MRRLRRRKTCAWPGCGDRPAERGESGMCVAHAGGRHADALATAYLELADGLEDLAHDARSQGLPEGVRPLPPGPRELERLAHDCRTLAHYRLPDLPDRRPRGELLTDKPGQLGVVTNPIEAGMYGLRSPDYLGHRLTRDEWATLMAVLGRLSPSEHEALILVRGRGLTHKEAAQEMGLSAGSLYNLLKRAEVKLDTWRSGTPAQAVWDF